MTHVTSLGEAREEHGPLSRVSEAGVVSVYEDCDGDHWLAKHQFMGDHGDDNSQAILLKGETLPNSLEALDDAGLLPDEYQPDTDDDTRDPSDVAEIPYNYGESLTEFGFNTSAIKRWPDDMADPDGPVYDPQRLAETFNRLSDFADEAFVEIRSAENNSGGVDRVVVTRVRGAPELGTFTAPLTEVPADE